MDYPLRAVVTPLVDEVLNLTVPSKWAMNADAGTVNWKEGDEGRQWHGGLFELVF